MNITIKRISNRDGTFGVLIVDGYPIGLTLEPEWKDNKSNISCIPPGKYKCKRVDSPTYGDTFEVTDVNGRDNILFHWGNLPINTKGCILVGEEFGKLDGKTAILASKRAFNELKNILADEDEFELLIYISH
jgi:hypothetical protein